MLPLVVGSNVGHSLHDLSRIEETNKTFFLFSLLMTSPRDHKDLDLLLVDAQLRCAHEDQLCLGAQGPYAAAGYHDDDYHYTLPCVGGPTDRQAAAQPRLRLTAAAGRAATLHRACRQRPFAAETHAIGGPERALRWAATLQLRAAVLFWFSRNHFLILSGMPTHLCQSTDRRTRASRRPIFDRRQKCLGSLAWSALLKQPCAL